jgi:hypothetical protein
MADLFRRAVLPWPQHAEDFEKLLKRLAFFLFLAATQIARA